MTEMLHNLEITTLKTQTLTTPYLWYQHGWENPSE